MESMPSERSCVDRKVDVDSDELAVHDEEDVGALGYTESVSDVVQSLVQERDSWKTKAQELTTIIEELDQCANISQAD